MPVKLVARQQVEQSRAAVSVGPVNALGFGSREPLASRRSPSPATSEQSHQGQPSCPSTDQDSEIVKPAPRKRRRRGPQPSERSARGRRWDTSRHRSRVRPRQVSRRVRQLQAQHDCELRLKQRRRIQKSVSPEALPKSEAQKEPSQQCVEMTSEALPSQSGVEQATVDSHVQTQEPQQAQAAEPQAHSQAPSALPHLKMHSVAESEIPKEVHREATVPNFTRRLRPPAVAMRRWRQARKRQSLLQQMQTVCSEMKSERRKLFAALKQPASSFSALEEELKQQGRELKTRFHTLSLRLSMNQKENQKRQQELNRLRAEHSELQLEEDQKRQQELNRLRAEHTELQLAFVNLLNVSMNRTSALRTSASPTPKVAPADDHDDDIIVEGVEDKKCPQEPQWRAPRLEDLQQEKRNHAARVELLLRAVQREDGWNFCLWAVAKGAFGRAFKIQDKISYCEVKSYLGLNGQYG